MKKNLFETQLFLLLLFATSFLQAQTTIPTADWEMYRSSNNVPAVPLIAQPANWDAAMSFQNIPAENSGDWEPAMQSGNWSVGWSGGSTIPSCNNFMQFGYLQTTLDIPANATNLSLSMTSLTDDLARAYVFNSQYPNGGHIAGRDGFWRLWLDPAPKDLSSFLVPGEINRIVVVHIDWCPNGNSIGVNAMYDWDLSAERDFDITSMTGLGTFFASAEGTSNGLDWTICEAYMDPCCGANSNGTYNGFNTSDFAPPRWLEKTSCTWACRRISPSRSRSPWKILFSICGRMVGMRR